MGNRQRTDNTMGNRRTDNAMDKQYNGQQTKDKRTDNTMGNRQRIKGQTIQWAIDKGQTIQWAIKKG
jgi:hypothetical protein